MKLIFIFFSEKSKEQQRIVIRMKRSLLLIFLSAAFFFRTPGAIANECGKWLSNFTSPVCTDAKYIFWTGAALSLSIRLLKHEFENEVQDRATQKNHLKHWAEVGGDIGFGYLNATYALGQILFGGSEGGVRAEHMTEASLYTFGMTMAIKKSVHESRPGYPDDPDSFPSGHSSFAFAFASVVTAQHGWGWGVGAHLLAAFIGFSRINDNWHYLHDVVAGMTIGMSYGWGIYFNHKDHGKPYWLALQPTENLDGLAFAFSYQF